MTDTFETHARGLTSPAEHAFQITPDDGADLPVIPRMLLIAGSGDVRVTTAGGETLTIAGLSGQLALRVRRVFATGTTATGLYGLY